MTAPLYPSVYRRWQVLAVLAAIIALHVMRDPPDDEDDDPSTHDSGVDPEAVQSEDDEEEFDDEDEDEWEDEDADEREDVEGLDEEDGDDVSPTGRRSLSEPNLQNIPIRRE